MYRTHTCGELRLEHQGRTVTLSGWVQRVRDLGAMTFVTLRDRYGITQLNFNTDYKADLCERAQKLGREYVLQVTGTVIERSSKNPDLPTGEIELQVDELTVLSKSEVPPFTIETETDGGEELRMKYRYLDLRRDVVQKNFIVRHELMQAVRSYLSGEGFLETETPYLIKSTPEGARDFVVPSRMHKGAFYALPQSPQTFKQLLMVSGFDKYFQIVKCFRDEDFRADRQPEFTQIDCELSFVDQEDIITIFSGLVKHLFESLKGYDLGDIPRMTYADAIKFYGSDKPDTRFDMRFGELNDLVAGTDFVPFKAALENDGLVVGIKAENCAGDYSRKKLDKLTDFVKADHRAMKGLIYVKYNADGSVKSSVDKFFDQEQLKGWLERFDAKPNDLLLILAGETNHTRRVMNELRLHVADELGLRDKNVFSALWVVDFPMFEQDEDSGVWHAMHHPFTSPKAEHTDMLDSDRGSVLADAYDFVINGNEIAGGSIRIHDQGMQAKVFEAIGLSDAEARAKFGFLLDALQYGAPPHGGIAFGFDRLAALFCGTDSIRDVIAFPKNNAGRDLMIDAPDVVDDAQLDELGLELKAAEAVN